MKRVFYIEWRHKCDSCPMATVLQFDNVEDLLDFFTYEEDPLVYFSFQDITNKDIEYFEQLARLVNNHAV